MAGCWRWRRRAATLTGLIFVAVSRAISREFFGLSPEASSWLSVLGGSIA